MQSPKLIKSEQWEGYSNPPWFKKDRDRVTIIYNFIERRKSFFMRAYFERHGYKYRDLGDHVKEDVRWGKEYGNRMECNPMYFTSGSLIRNLFKLHNEEGYSKAEVVDKFVFLGGGGQCGPCRYGMYPQEYFKVVNDAGFKNFRMFLFSSDLLDPTPKNSAFRFDMVFRINFTISFILADLMHVAECALRPYALDKQKALAAITDAEKMLLKAYTSRLHLVKVPLALRKAGKALAAIPRRSAKLPFIYMTGEIFANLAHNDGNYNLRRFIMDEGCEVAPGLFTNRALYEFWRRETEAKKRIKYASGRAEEKEGRKTRIRQIVSRAVVKGLYLWFKWWLRPEQFGGKADLHNLDELAAIGFEYYHPEIFGGEGNLEIAEALHLADKVDGFISSKPFGCMPSSGVSDGVQAKIMALKPQLNFLSIETSGDNEVNILSRVSMLLFKAKQKVLRETGLGPEVQSMP
jgi:predicted nucleotide-binding protein (sugar kinase/HSP70/actin superfamily)